MKLDKCKLKAETIVKSPEDIDSSVMLNGDKHEEQRKRREADIHLLRTLKPLPMEKRSMIKEKINKTMEQRRRYKVG